MFTNGPASYIVMAGYSGLESVDKITSNEALSTHYKKHVNGKLHYNWSDLTYNILNVETSFHSIDVRRNLISFHMCT